MSGFIWSDLPAGRQVFIQFVVLKIKRPNTSEDEVRE